MVNVIDENIRLCRRLIIIIDPDELSFDLLKNLPEEQIAVYSALIQDGIKVILIELGKGRKEAPGRKQEELVGGD